MLAGEGEPEWKQARGVPGMLEADAEKDDSGGEFHADPGSHLAKGDFVVAEKTPR